MFFHKVFFSSFFSSAFINIRLLIFLVLFTGLPITARSSDPTFTANRKPTLSIQRFQTPIVIDGNLDDEAWKSAVRAGNFAETRPKENTKPPVDTETLIGYDDHNLYFAFIAHDNPSDIRASLQDRDRIFGDDFIGIILDTYQSSQWAYEIYVNPIGVQGDLRMTAGGDEDEGLDLVFESKGKITENGYQVEVAIPFSSLRFPDKAEQTWDFNILRIHPRESRRQISWVSVDRNNPCWFCQFGTMTGIKNIRPGSALQILPSVVAVQSGAISDYDNPTSPFHNDDIKHEISLGIRYPISSNLAISATYNPDFSQIESDAAQINVNSTFALFYPERRPFFNEGADMYRTWINSVYTRSINDPIFAARINGGIGNTSYGVISAVDENTPIIVPFEEKSSFAAVGKSWTSIGRVRHSFGDGSFLGALLTDLRITDGGSGSSAGMDGMYRFWDNFQVESQVVLTQTTEPNGKGITGSNERFSDGKYSANFDGEEFTGFATYLGLKHYGRHLAVEWTANQYSPQFRVANGFESRNNRQITNFWSGYRFFPDTDIIEDFQPALSVGRVWNFDGERKDEWLVPMINIRFKGQTSFHADYLFSRETFRGEYFPGIRRYNINANTAFSKYLQANFSMTAGRSIARSVEVPVLGKELTVSGSMTIKPFDRLSIEQSADYFHLDYPDGSNIFDGYVTRTRLDYQHTRELSLRVVMQYNGFDRSLHIEPLLSYKINPFSIFYLGSSAGWRNYRDEFQPDGKTPYSNSFERTSRQFFLKLQYLFSA